MEPHSCCCCCVQHGNGTIRTRSDMGRRRKVSEADAQLYFERKLHESQSRREMDLEDREEEFARVHKFSPRLRTKRYQSGKCHARQALNFDNFLERNKDFIARREAWRRDSKRMKDSEQLEACDFQPRVSARNRKPIRSEDVFDFLYRDSFERLAHKKDIIDKYKEEMKFKGIEGCTFQPNVGKRKKKLHSTSEGAVNRFSAKETPSTYAGIHSERRSMLSSQMESEKKFDFHQRDEAGNKDNAFLHNALSAEFSDILKNIRNLNSILSNK